MLKYKVSPIILYPQHPTSMTESVGSAFLDTTNTLTNSSTSALSSPLTSRFSCDMASDKKSIAPLEKPEDIQLEYETSSRQVAGEIEPLPGTQDAHHSKALTRRLLWKLDTRCVLFEPTPVSPESLVLKHLHVGSSPFFASCFYAHSSTEPTSATPKSWASRRIWGYPTDNMPTGSPSSLPFISRLSCLATWYSSEQVQGYGWLFLPLPGASPACVWALFGTTPVSSRSGQF